MASTPEPAELLIGELAGSVGVTPAAIRHYERIGLLAEPARTSSGYRIYGAQDVERLAFVRRAQRVGLTLDEIRQVLVYRRDGRQPCNFVLDAVRRHAAEVDDRIAELERVRDELAAVVSRAGDEGTDRGAYCDLLESVDELALADRP